LEKGEEKEGSQTRTERLGKEVSEQGEIKVFEGDGYKAMDQNEQETSFEEAEDEGKKKLEGKSFEVESFLEELRRKKGKRSGEGVKTQGISGKQVHEISHKESQNPAEERREHKGEIEGEDQEEVRPDPLNREEGPPRRLKDQE
jgi:hypothetical protein